MQRMPEKFTAAFAARLNSECEIEVREAKDNDWVVGLQDIPKAILSV